MREIRKGKKEANIDHGGAGFDRVTLGLLFHSEKTRRWRSEQLLEKLERG